MKACLWASGVFGAIVMGVSAFTACGGSTPPPAATPQAASAAPTPAASDVPPAPLPTAAAAAASEPAPSGSVGLPPGDAGVFRNADAVDGGPDRNLDDVRAIIANNRDSFRACYDKSLKAHPGIKGAFVLHFVVNPDGSVKTAEANQQKSEIHEADLAECAVGALKALKFPPSRRGMETTVNYPFDFKPGSHAGK